MQMAMDNNDENDDIMLLQNILNLNMHHPKSFRKITRNDFNPDFLDIS
jgi:hypothetical protein